MWISRSPSSGGDVDLWSIDPESGSITFSYINAGMLNKGASVS